MTNAYRDENGVPTIITVSNSDGKTVIRNLANPSTHRLLINDGTTGADNGNNNGDAMKDDNDISVKIVASSTDGQSPIELYSDHLTQRLLIKSH